MKHLSLRFKLLLLIGAVTFINISGSMVTIWYTYRTQHLYASIIDQDVSALMAAQKLETALVMQKGLVTYFFLTGSNKWLDRLEEYNNKFKFVLIEARDVLHLQEARHILNEIESRYIRFVNDRDTVIALYKAGQKDEGANQHWAVRDQFFTIYDLAEKFKKIHESSIAVHRQKVNRTGQTITILAWVATPSVLLLSLLLTYILFKQILTPIREMMVNTATESPQEQFGNEINALKNRMHDLVTDIHQTQAKLLQSQEHLVQSEKLAMVGKLAAGVAHSVRNPLTSLKMRLFTLERSLTMTPTQKEDLDVISEEIRHIDTILRNFLEFSRPPKLKFQMLSPSEVVDMTLQLLKHRMESYRIDIRVTRKERLPKLPLDPDQLKEVLVNLMVNACEAMSEGGAIQITEGTEKCENGPTAVLEIHDNGPGIPESIRGKIFEPFFSSKEEGSGLGLSIARRIIEEHGGTIVLNEAVQKGTSFIILLPLEETYHG